MVEHWPQGLQIGLWYPYFKPWDQYKAIKFNIYLVTWGRLKGFFYFSLDS
jgi:hypothetical protein